MRDLIDTIKFLSEAPTLAPNEFQNRPKRWETFINKIIKQEPFTTVDMQEVIVDPKEAERLQDLWDAGQFISNPQAAKVKLLEPFNGKNEIRLSNLKKTTEFGGAGVAVGAAPASGGKASYALKPQSIGITDRNIPADELYNEIVNNTVLQSTEHGKVVIQLAQFIVSGESVTVSDEVKKNKKLLAAIQDDAGEYLGVLALLYHRSRFPARENFEKWLGGDTGVLVLNFPSASNYQLADSFAEITNPETQHKVNISSKGKQGGAAPAISGLKISDSILKNPQLKNAVDFIKICQTKGTIDQAFDGIDLLYTTNPKSIDKVWHKFLPFSKNVNAKKQILASLKGQELKFGKEWNNIISSVKSEEATPGGKIIYAMKREVADAINNNDALPEFKDTVLEILEMNFVQQYTDFEKKHLNEFTFETQWPAKLDGVVTLENKSSAKAPTTGGFSFKLGRTDDSVSDEPGEERVDNEPGEADDFEQKAKEISKSSSDKSRDVITKAMRPKRKK